MKKIIGYLKFPARKVEIILISLGIVLLASLSLVRFVLPRSDSDFLFSKATKVVPESLLKQAIAENYKAAEPLNFQSVKAFKIPGERGKKLYIIDFNNRTLCGRAGCLYVAYTGEGKRVLSLYLQPYLPHSVSLFATDDRYSDGFPCLNISQFNDANTLSLSQHCYSEGSSYFVRINQHQRSLKREKRSGYLERSRESVVGKLAQNRPTSTE
jgi:hypothetical protein